MVVEAASMEYGLCQRCTTKEAVVKCRQCQRAVCGQCDRIVHEGLLHDREAIFGPYCHPLSPDMVVDNILGCHSIVKEGRKTLLLCQYLLCVIYPSIQILQSIELSDVLYRKYNRTVETALHTSVMKFATYWMSCFLSNLPCCLPII